MTNDTTAWHRKSTTRVDDPAELDRFLASYVPIDLEPDLLRRLAPAAIALVRVAGPYTRPRVQNDISVLAQVFARLVERGRPLTLDEALSDATRLDFDLAQQRRGSASKSRMKTRGILGRLQAAHHRVPWRKGRQPDGARIANLPVPGLAAELARVVSEAEADRGEGARALTAVVAHARRIRLGETTERVTSDPRRWQLARAFACGHGMVLTALALSAAVTHEALLTGQPIAVLVPRLSLTRRDLDLGLAHAAELPATPSDSHRAALRGHGTPVGVQ